MGIKHLNLSENTLEEIKDNLYAVWFKILFSNVQSSKLYNTTESVFDGETIKVLDYLLKLDPRINQNSQILMRVINLVNNTLLTKPEFYDPVTDNLTDIDTVAIVLPTTQVSCKNLFNKKFFLFNTKN